MKFPFVSRKKYDDVVLKLEDVLYFATDGLMRDHTQSIFDMRYCIGERIADQRDKAVAKAVAEKDERIENLQKYGENLRKELDALGHARRIVCEKMVHSYDPEIVKREMARDFAEYLQDVMKISERGTLHWSGTEIRIVTAEILVADLSGEGQL